VLVGRLIQGIGAGAASVVAFRLPAARLTEPGDRGTALGTMGIIVGLLSGAGALVAGILTQDLSWRRALALPGLSIPIIALMAPAREAQRADPLDIRGALLCAVAGAALTVLI
jgi:MFS family permease